MTAPASPESSRTLSSRRPTYLQVAADKTMRLLAALDPSASDERVRRLLATVLGDVGATPVGDGPLSPTPLSEDHSPFELSVAFERGDTAEVRILVEPQASQAGVRAQWQAALALSEPLSKLYSATFDRFFRVADLFEPAPGATFGAWYGVSLSGGEPSGFKIYLNPLARGQARAVDTVFEALRRLGFVRALPKLQRLLSAAPRSSFCYFSLDLAHDSRARIKVYTLHPSPQPSDLDTLTTEVAGPTFAECGATLARFVEAMTGTTGRLEHKPLQLCWSYVEERRSAPRGSDEPANVTVHAPIEYYSPNDAVARDRIEDFMRSHALPVELHQRAIEAIRERALAERPGLQTYSSLRVSPGNERMTVYLAAELFPRLRPAVWTQPR